MGKQLVVGNRTFEWADKEVTEAFWATISYRLEPAGRGTRFPMLLGPLAEGKLSLAQAEQALSEIDKMASELKGLSVDKVIAHLSTLSRLSDQNLNVNRNAHTVYDYFICLDQRPMAQVLREALLASQQERKSLTIKTGGFSRSLGSHLMAGLMVCMGLGMMYWTWHDVKQGGSYRFKMALFSPMMLLIGVVGFFHPPILRRTYLGGVTNYTDLAIQIGVAILGLSLGYAYTNFLDHSF